MKFAPMNYHYLRYPIKKFLDKVERSPFNSIDLYCSAPQLNLFDYPLLRLIELKKEIEAHHLSVMAMTPENCVYPVNFCTQDDLTRESSIRYYQRAIDTAQFLDCPCVQISTGFGYFDQPREEGWKYCRESLWTLAQYCEKKDVRLLLEELKVTTTNVLITSKDIAKMLEEIESPSIVGMVDMDQMTYAKETIDDYFDNLGDKLQHMEECIYNPAYDERQSCEVYRSERRYDERQRRANTCQCLSGGRRDGCSDEQYGKQPDRTGWQ